MIITERLLADLRVGMPRDAWRALVRDAQLAGMRLHFGAAADGLEYCDLSTEWHQLLGRVYHDADNTWRMHPG